MNLRLFAIILLSAFVFCACKKNGAASPGFTGVRIKTEATDGDTTTYVYDSKGRVINILNNDSGKSVYTYTDSTVLEDYYASPGVLTYHDVFSLGSNGLATKYTDSRDAGRHIIYAYNSDGQLSGAFDFNNGAPDTLSKAIYSYSNGNLDSIIYVGIIEDPLYYTYYTDKTNTLTNENFGVAWRGASSKNLIKAYVNGQDLQGNPRLFAFHYEYDAQGRIIKLITDQAPFAIEPVTYTYY